MKDDRANPCLAVIPARGGSKGIPGKNMRNVAGKPLVCYAIEALIDSGIEVDIAVSSDSDAILELAGRYAGVYALRRPDQISGDEASTEDALVDAIEQVQSITGKRYASVMTVQPTSPFRTPGTIIEFWQAFQLLDDSHDALLTLNETRADYWVCEEGQFARLYPDAPRRRQERTPLYVENSCLYATMVESLLETRSVLGHSAQGFLIGQDEALDINEPIDLTIAETLMQR